MLPVSSRRPRRPRVAWPKAEQRWRSSALRLLGLSAAPVAQERIQSLAASLPCISVKRSNEAGEELPELPSHGPIRSPDGLHV